MIWVIFSRLALGLRGASVRRTGCSSGATRSSLRPFYEKRMGQEVDGDTLGDEFKGYK